MLAWWLPISTGIAQPGGLQPTLRTSRLRGESAKDPTGPTQKVSGNSLGKGDGSVPLGAPYFSLSVTGASISSLKAAGHRREVIGRDLPVPFLLGSLGNPRG